MKKAIEINGQFKVFNEIPKVWTSSTTGKHELRYDLLDTSIHTADGWKDFQEPVFDSNTHKKTSTLILTNNIVTYQIVPLTPEEISQNETSQLSISKARLNPLVAKSRVWLRAILMGKTLEDDLEYFEDVYRTKYNQCTDPNGTFDTLLTMEAQLEGFANVSDYKAYVIGRWEQGLGFYEGAKGLLEVFRKRVLKDFDDNDKAKADLRMDELDGLPSDLNPMDFQTEFERIMAL